MALVSNDDLDSIGIQACLHGISKAPTSPILGTAINGADMPRGSGTGLPVSAVLDNQQQLFTALLSF